MLNTALTYGELKDLRRAAAVDFQSWPDEAFSGWTPPTVVQWAELANPVVIDLRIAWAVLRMTKAEVIASSKTWLDSDKDESSPALMSRELEGTAAMFREMARMLDVATARLLVAESVLALREEGDDHV